MISMATKGVLQYVDTITLPTVVSEQGTVASTVELISQSSNISSLDIGSSTCSNSSAETCSNMTSSGD